MHYDAITIDSNVFIHSGFNLETGLLGQLTQFKDGVAEFVLSEIVVRELKRRLTEEARKGREKIAQAIKPSKAFGYLSGDLIASIEESISGALSAEQAAEQRLSNFLKNTGAIIVPATQADLAALVTRYFDAVPPFDRTGDKKSEFPDAIPLLSIESWAQKGSKRLLAVSKDRGWIDFARGIEHIEVLTDLSAALQKLQANAEEARSLINAVLRELDSGTRGDIHDELNNRIAQEVEMLTFATEAESAFQYEEDESFLVFKRFELGRSGTDIDFDVVRVGHQKIVARVSVQIFATAEAQFSLSVWDSIDKESIPMGSTRKRVDTDFEASVLLTFDIGGPRTPSQIDVSDVSLTDTLDSIYFGEIGPDHHRDEVEF